MTTLNGDKRRNEEIEEMEVKKAKVAEEEESHAFPDGKPAFSEGLFSEERKEGLKKYIEESGPYKHGVLNPLFNDTLLHNVREEIMNEIQFTKKETDIYKVYQTGDLANLSSLGKEELTKLSSLNTLRNALYSQEFRDYLSYVTGAGPLSGVKKDLSINVYQKGCHLLNHDDVIGSRRISYILYLPDPDEPWNPKWGGALRLYSTLTPNIPSTDWELPIPPAWNQLAFFTVQPGLSFHDVEEVYVERPRMSISGWFHIPQPGERGYIEGEQEKIEGLSSLKQLESKNLEAYDFPKMEMRKKPAKDLVDIETLSEEDVKFLSDYLNPKLLDTENLQHLNDKFGNDSLIEIKDFLNEGYAKAVRKSIDVDDLAKIPGKSTEIPNPWDVARPPHKARYLYLDENSEISKVEETETLAAHKKLQEVRELFQSTPFYKWLYQLSGMGPVGDHILARRFRPGYDFTLATTSDSEDSVLEGTLSLTPSKGWGDGEVGGYELTMSVDEDSKDSDPAVYGAQTDGDDDPVLLTNQADWNVFSLIARDSGILRFVKYVSKNATGSRWDLFGTWEVAQDDDEEDVEEEKERA